MITARTRKMIKIKRMMIKIKIKRKMITARTRK